MGEKSNFSQKWSWRLDLHAYDDGLGETRLPNQEILFSACETRKIARNNLIESLEDGTTKGTTNLPTFQELADSNPNGPTRRGLWVGWYLPLQPSTEPHPATRVLSVKDLVTQKASKDQLEAITVSRNCPTALKVIVPINARKRLDYFALAEPDPTTGLCKAFQIGGASKSIYFFPEFRDQADDLIDATKRCRAWGASILEIAGKKDSDDDDEEQDDEDNGNKDKDTVNKSAKQKSGKARSKSKSGMSMPGNSKSAVAGAGIGAGGSLGIQTLRGASTAAAPVSASALNPIDASQIAKLRAGLAELRSKMTLKLYNEIRGEVGKLTKVEFPIFPSSAYLDAFIRKKRLKKRHAKLAVDEFFVGYPSKTTAKCLVLGPLTDYLQGLYPFLRRESLTKLNHFLVHVASIVLSSDTEGIIVLSWDTIQDFLLTLAYICDARYAEEPELKRKVFLAFEMVRKEVGVLSQSKEATPRDRIQDFLSGVIDNMDRQLVVHAENCRLAASLGEGTHTTGAAIVDRWVKRLREQASDMQEAARPFKRLRQLVNDDDDANDLPEPDLDSSGSIASSNGVTLAAADSTGDSADTPSHQHAEGENLGSSSRPAPDDFHDASSHIAEPSTVEVKPSGPGTPPGTPNSDSHLSDPESLVTGPGSPKDPDSLAVLQLLNAA